MDKTTNTVYTVTDQNGYQWRGATIAKGATIDTANATTAELDQLGRDARGPNAKLSAK